MRSVVPLLATALCAGLSAATSAQELEPRAYSPNPTNANFVLLAYGRTQGDVVVDSSIPLRDVSAELNAGTLLYGRTFGLFGRSASAGIGVPYAWGSIEGAVGETFRRITRSGLSDARLRLTMNILGGPALAPPEFARRRPRTTLGASLLVQAPTGQYDGAKLINLGSNRWSFKPELGASQPLGRVFVELYAGAWLFTPNDDFFGGQLRKQDPVGTFQIHTSYTFRPRLWVAADATYYVGGQSTLDGVEKDDRLSNTRLGLTAAIPLGRHQSVKLAYASGVATRIGSDFDSYSVAWQYLWFDHRK
jgi:hypothetical protein